MKYPAAVASALPALVVVIVAALASCTGMPVAQYPDAAAFVSAELASVAAAGEFDYDVVDFSAAQGSARGVDASGIRFQSLTGNIGFQLGRRVVGGEAPPEGRFVGSPEHLRLLGAGSVRLESPATVLGMHVSLTHNEALAHRWLTSGTEARLLVTGVDTRGTPTGTVKAVPASATPEATKVETNWMWVDLSILGEVAELELAFESPLEELPVILLDNFTLSANFAADRNFFTVALLADTASYLEERPDVLDAQIGYLASSARSDSGEPLVFAAHLGNIVPDGSSEEQWEAIDRTLRPLDRAVPYTIGPGQSDLEDPEDPLLGSPFFLGYFSAGRFAAAGRNYGASDDGYSAYQIVRTPVGEMLALQLALDAPGPTLDWAAEILDAHQDLPTMVFTPSYLTVRDDYIDRLDEPVLPSEDEEWQPVSAQTVWEELIWPRSQIFLVACTNGAGEAIQISRNRADKPVIELLTSYSRRPDGGEGYLRLLRFYPARSELRVITYSPWLDTYEMDLNSSIRIPLDITGRPGLD